MERERAVRQEGVGVDEVDEHVQEAREELGAAESLEVVRVVVSGGGERAGEEGGGCDEVALVHVEGFGPAVAASGDDAE